jgi:hypothetical protein
MEEFQNDEDRRATAEVRAVYEGTPLKGPQRRTDRAASAAQRSATADRTERKIGASIHGMSAPSKQSDDDEPLDWWLVFSGLLALILSLPVTHWVDDRFGGIPPLLNLWAFFVPTLVMAIAIGWFMFRAPRPPFDGGSLGGAVVMSPVLLIIGIVGNILTCGLGVPLAALMVINEANSARRIAAPCEES